MENTGQCLCGAVTYSFTGGTDTVVMYHCKNCQRQSGSAYSLNLVVPSEGVRLTGKLKRYEDKGEGGAPVYREFCPEFGSPVRSFVTGLPGMDVFKVGTLHKTENISPQVQIWCTSAVAGLKIDASVPAFDKNIPS